MRKRLVVLVRRSWVLPVAAVVTQLALLPSGTTAGHGRPVPVAFAQDVIDPITAYSFTLGGSGTETITSIAADAAGAVYVAGYTTSLDFPTANALQGTPGRQNCAADNSPECRDGFIAKLSASGTIEFATYFGGTGDDSISAIAVSLSGDIYIAGHTWSDDLPGTTAAGCGAAGTNGGCAFVTHLSSGAAQVLYTSIVARSCPSTPDDTCGLWTSVAVVALQVDGSGIAHLILRKSGSASGHCSAESLVEVRSDGAFSTIETRGDCSGAGLAVHFSAAAGDGDGGVFVAGNNWVPPFPSHETTGNLTHYRGDQGVAYSTDFPSTAPAGIAAAPDGRTFVGLWHWRSARATVDVLDRFGQPMKSTPIAANAAWASFVGPFIGRAASGFVNATVCGDGAECINTVLSPQGTVLRSDVLPPPASLQGGAFVRFSTDGAGSLFSASGSADAPITKHYFPAATLETGPTEVRAGVPSTWTAAASPGTGLEFSFYRFDDATGWTQVQPYGPAATYTWTPAGSDVGRHELQVWVRAEGSTAAYDAWAGLPIDVTAAGPVVITDLRTADPLPARVGAPLVWVATASGGLAPLQFKFLRRDADGWHVAQDYSAANTYTYTPSDADGGSHDLQVWVRDAGASRIYDAWAAASFDVEILPLSVAPPVPSRPVPLTIGQAVVWTAVASGGRAPRSYKFVRLDADGWHVVQDYGLSNTYTHTPSAADAGPHTLQVWVRAEGSTAMYDAWSAVTYGVGGPLSVTSLDPSVDPRTIQKPVTWIALASGGVAPLEFKFLRLDADGWHVAQDYSLANTYTYWRPASNAGLALQVWVRSAGSTALYDAWRGVTFEVTDSPPLTLTLRSFGPTLYGTLQWQVTATGGTAPLSYQFVRLDADGWHVVQAYSSSSFYSWTPAPTDAGFHALQVWVKSAWSTAQYDAWIGTEFVVK